MGYGGGEGSRRGCGRVENGGVEGRINTTRRGGTGGGRYIGMVGTWKGRKGEEKTGKWRRGRENRKEIKERKWERYLLLTNK